MSTTITVSIDSTTYQALLAKLKYDKGVIADTEFLAVLATLGYSTSVMQDKSPAEAAASWSSAVADQALLALK